MKIGHQIKFSSEKCLETGKGKNKQKKRNALIKQQGNYSS